MNCFGILVFFWMVILRFFLDLEKCRSDNGLGHSSGLVGLIVVCFYFSFSLSGLWERVCATVAGCLGSLLSIFRYIFFEVWSLILNDFVVLRGIFICFYS